jgi:hypothetical protein
MLDRKTGIFFFDKGVDHGRAGRPRAQEAAASDEMKLRYDDGYLCGYTDRLTLEMEHRAVLLPATKKMPGV